MPIKHTIKAEDNLEKAVGEVLKNPRNAFDIQGVITITPDAGQRVKDQSSKVRLYLDEKYAEFSGDFVQQARTESNFESLMNYIDKNNWKTNLE